MGNVLMRKETRKWMKERNDDKNNVHLYVIVIHAISMSITMVRTGIVTFSGQFLMPQSILRMHLSIMSCEFGLVHICISYNEHELSI